MSHDIKITFSDEEWNLLIDAAKKTNCTVEDFIRYVSIEGLVDGARMTVEPVQKYPAIDWLNTHQAEVERLWYLGARVIAIRKDGTGIAAWGKDYTDCADQVSKLGLKDSVVLDGVAEPGVAYV